MTFNRSSEEVGPVILATPFLQTHIPDKHRINELFPHPIKIRYQKKHNNLIVTTRSHDDCVLTGKDGQRKAVDE